VDVGRTLRHARRRARLTQRQLAETTGVPQSTVGRIEAGLTMPRVDTFEKLLEACGMDIELTHTRGQGLDVTLIEDLLKLTPDERVRRCMHAWSQLEPMAGALNR
jgi:transcriptional regulator with XRE-family HTH domain